MGAVVVILSVLAASLVVFAIVCVALTSLIYKKMFGSRFSHDPLVTTYSPKLLGLESSPVEVELDGEKLRGGLYAKKGRETDKNVIVIVCHGIIISILNLGLAIQLQIHFQRIIQVAGCIVMVITIHGLPL